MHGSVYYFMHNMHKSLHSPGGRHDLETKALVYEALIAGLDVYLHARNTQRIDLDKTMN